MNNFTPRNMATLFMIGLTTGFIAGACVYRISDRKHRDFEFTRRVNFISGATAGGICGK